jgi:ribosomal protein S18 acetylase RimI-like enzyme
MGDELPGMHLHEVHPDDWQSYRDLRLEGLLDAPDAFWFTYADEAAYDEADWRERIEGAWLVQARDDEGVLGSAGLGLHWEPERATEATLFGMYVTPRGRGRGVGEALVAAVLEEARRRGKSEIVLEVASANSAARALYERCGFVPTGARHPHPRNADLHEIEMVRTL